ncbi:hypothetical protein G6F32_017017 [Rhizopus arrhizus]|nr:hypothetical protein G6F32_017017 [Rhizopus arrhizus]
MPRAAVGPGREDGRRHQRHEDGFKVGRADGYLAPVKHVQHYRIQRAQQHRAGRDGQDHVVRQQQRFPRQQRKAAA